jgi:hypothetical protein
LYARGAKKYGDRNWQKGIPDERVYASLLRHAYAAIQGDITEDHLAAVVFNAFALMYYQDERKRKSDALDVAKGITHNTKLTPAQPLPVPEIVYKFNIGDKVFYPSHNVSGVVIFKGDIHKQPAYGLKLDDGEFNGFRVLVNETEIVAKPPEPKYKIGDRVDFHYLLKIRGSGEVTAIPGLNQSKYHVTASDGRKYALPESEILGLTTVPRFKVGDFVSYCIQRSTPNTGKITEVRPIGQTPYTYVINRTAVKDSEVSGLVIAHTERLPVGTWVTVKLYSSPHNGKKCKIHRNDGEGGYDYYVQSEAGHFFWIAVKEITQVHAKYMVGEYVKVQGFSTMFKVTNVHEVPDSSARYDLSCLPYTLKNHPESLLSSYDKAA